jgi:hypothetical protein
LFNEPHSAACVYSADIAIAIVTFTRYDLLGRSWDSTKNHTHSHGWQEQSSRDCWKPFDHIKSSLVIHRD